MAEIELVLGLLVVVALIATLSRRIGVPYPILMVLGGLLLGLLPGVPRVVLSPDLVLLIFLPPILFAAAFFTSLRDLRANIRQIGQLAFVLVLITMTAVAFVAHAMVPAIGWPAAFALGAIVSPPDAISATAIAQRLELPRRAVVILEGESLVNDATALTAYRVAVGAVAGGFLAAEAGLQLLITLVGGILIGLAVGWIIVRIEGWLNDAPVETIVSLIAPFAAYLPAERLGVSGVLACVTAGLMLGRAAPRALTSQSRILGGSVWEMVIFLVYAFVFVLIGLQLPLVVGSTGRSLGQFVLVGISVAAVVIGVRLAWVFLAHWVAAWLSRDRAHRPPKWKGLLVLSWAGMRGSVSLAAALALPTDPLFPGRDLIIFAAFVVILATLVGQGLTLPLLIRRLGFTGDMESGEEELHARQIATEAALSRIEGLRGEWPDHQPLVQQLAERYQHRTEHVNAGPDDEAADQELLEHQRIRHEVIEAERLAVIHLRDVGEISDSVLRRLERELDLEELRMEA